MRILIVTDLRFWEKDKGSKQRVSALVKFLSSKNEVFILYSNHTLGRSFSENSISDEYSLQKIFVDHNSLTLLSRIVKKLKTIFRTYIAFCSRFIPPSVNFVFLTLFPSFRRKFPEAIFAPPIPLGCFEDIARLSHIDCVIFEFLRVHNSLNNFRAIFPDAVTFIDTHDVLSQRFLSFNKYNYPHPKITSSEEAYLLSFYDNIIAISESDRDHFSRMVDSLPIVMSHYVSARLDNNRRSIELPPIKLSFLGAYSSFNFDSLFVLLNLIMPVVRRYSVVSFELNIAGSICNTPAFLKLMKKVDLSNVNILGLVDSLSDFYNSTHIFVNPVRFGGGLKIKNVEALAHGCILATTKEGSKGLAAELDSPFLLIEDDPLFLAQKIVKLINSPDRLEFCLDGGRSFAIKYNSPELAYGKFYSCFKF